MKKTKAAAALITASALVLGSMSTGSIVFAEAGGSDLNIMLETPVESLDPQQATDGTSFEVIADYTDGQLEQWRPRNCQRLRIRMAESRRSGHRFRIRLHAQRYRPGGKCR